MSQCKTDRKIQMYEYKDTKANGIIAMLEGFFTRYIVHINIVHAVMFVVLCILLFLPLFLSEPLVSDTPLSHFTVTAHYAMWGVWFPLVLLSVVLSGRSWCGLLCPMGAASEWVNKKGLRKPIPRWMRWEGTPIVSFIVITTLGQTVGVRDHPEAIAEVFGGLMLAAIIIGFIYGNKKRAWCRHMCPVGLLLGVYSRLGAVEFTQRNKKRIGGDQYQQKGICPTMIDISAKEESRHCIECFRCVNPKSKGGLTLRLRRPGEEVENIKAHNPNKAEVWFFFLGTGSALGGFLWLVLPLYQSLRMQLGEWFIGNEWYWIGDSGPWWLMSVHPERREVFNWLDFFMIVGFMTAVMLVVATILYGTTLMASKIAARVNDSQSSSEWFVQLAYQYMPIAMGSLLIGLGGELFNLLGLLGLNVDMIKNAKLILIVVCLQWSYYLGYKILCNQGMSKRRCIGPLIPGMVGSTAVAVIWYTAIFGGFIL